MRRLVERLLQHVPLHGRSRRAIDETLNDWRYESEHAVGPGARLLCDGRSTASVLRALMLLTWRSPMQATSPREEIIGVIRTLSPDASYEDIVREIAARHAGTLPHQRHSHRDGSLRSLALRIPVLLLLASLAGAALQIWLTPRRYYATAYVHAEVKSADVTSLARIAPSCTFRYQPASRLASILCFGTSAQGTAAMANTAAQRYIADNLSREPAMPTAILEYAQAPSRPIAPNVRIILLGWLSAGFAVSVLVVVARPRWTRTAVSA